MDTLKALARKAILERAGREGVRLAKGCVRCGKKITKENAKTFTNTVVVGSSINPDYIGALYCEQHVPQKNLHVFPEEEGG